jgi:hypothetical protein
MRIVLAFVQQLNAKLTFDRLDPGTEFVLLGHCETGVRTRGSTSRPAPPS